MEQHFPVLAKTPLFSGIEREDLAAMLGCLRAKTRRVQKDGFVLLAGEKPVSIGVVLAGQMNVLKEDYSGSRAIMAALVPGDIFAEALCCAGVEESPVSVAAGSDAAVLLLDYSRILHPCGEACRFHRQLLQNLLRIIANKNLFLQDRTEVLRQKTVRAKVLLYLETLAAQQGAEVAVPFNREELADFLCVERTALSHELSKMKRDGLLDYRKNRFTLNF